MGTVQSQHDNLDNNNNANIWGLGFVSLFNDLSSEVVTRVLPIYLLSVVGATYVGVGVVEAISEATSILGKLVSGYYSDRFRKRKPMVFAGYALSVFSRPLIIATPALTVVSVARFFDRVGKAVRTPPRDALIADLSHRRNRGANFGINRALDTVGAVVGLGAVVVYLHLSHNTGVEALKTIIIAASLVGVVALFVLGFSVHELPGQAGNVTKTKPRLSISALDRQLRHYLVIAGLFSLANSSDAFLIVRARELGLSLQGIFLVLMCFNFVSAVMASPMAKLSDKRGRKIMLMIGWIIYVASYLGFGADHLSKLGFLGMMLLYGLFYSFTEGVEKALVADFETGDRKGLAYGWLGVVQGICVIPANLIFAYIYEGAAGARAFWLSAVFAVLGLILLAFFKPQPLERA